MPLLSARIREMPPLISKFKICHCKAWNILQIPLVYVFYQYWTKLPLPSPYSLLTLSSLTKFPHFLSFTPPSPLDLFSPHGVTLPPPPPSLAPCRRLRRLGPAPLPLLWGLRLPQLGTTLTRALLCHIRSSPTWSSAVPGLVFPCAPAAPSAPCAVPPLGSPASGSPALRRPGSARSGCCARFFPPVGLPSSSVVDCLGSLLFPIPEVTGCA